MRNCYEILVYLLLYPLYTAFAVCYIFCHMESFQKVVHWMNKITTPDALPKKGHRCVKCSAPDSYSFCEDWSGSYLGCIYCGFHIDLSLSVATFVKGRIRRAQYARASQRERLQAVKSC